MLLVTEIKHLRVIPNIGLTPEVLTFFYFDTLPATFNTSQVLENGGE